LIPGGVAVDREPVRATALNDFGAGLSAMP
jgi:hypothetical protein